MHLAFLLHSPQNTSRSPVSIKESIMKSVFLAIALLMTTLFLPPVASAKGLGSEFALTSQTGNIVTSESLKGKPFLMFFGFTYCPAMCPTALATMTAAGAMLQADAPQNVFITIDPERDDVAALQKMAVKYPHLIALTGSAEAIAAVAEGYHAFYTKNAKESGNPKEYQMDHSGFIYLMDANGQYVAHFPFDIFAKELAEKIKDLLKISR
jgi:protein SCO1/2